MLGRIDREMENRKLELLLPHAKVKPLLGDATEILFDWDSLPQAENVREGLARFVEAPGATPVLTPGGTANWRLRLLPGRDNRAIQFEDRGYDDLRQLHVAQIGQRELILRDEAKKEYYRLRGGQSLQDALRQALTKAEVTKLGIKEPPADPAPEDGKGDKDNKGG